MGAEKPLVIALPLCEIEIGELPFAKQQLERKVLQYRAGRIIRIRWGVAEVAVEEDAALGGTAQIRDCFVLEKQQVGSHLIGFGARLQLR